MPTRDMRVVEQRRRVDIEALLRDPTVKKWSESRSEGPSRVSSLYKLAAFVRWRESQALPTSPGGWIKECMAGTSTTLNKHLDCLLGWVNGEEFDGARMTTKIKSYNTVRSFYAKNRVELPREKLTGGGSRREEPKVPVKMTATKFLEMSGKVLGGGLSVRDRSVILTMIQSGMDASTLCRVFNRVAYPQLVRFFGTDDWQLWDPGKAPVRVDLLRP